MDFSILVKENGDSKYDIITNVFAPESHKITPAELAINAERTDATALPLTKFIRSNLQVNSSKLPPSCGNKPNKI